MDGNGRSQADRPPPWGRNGGDWNATGLFQGRVEPESVGTLPCRGPVFSACCQGTRNTVSMGILPRGRLLSITTRACLGVGGYRRARRPVAERLLFVTPCSWAWGKDIVLSWNHARPAFVSGKRVISSRGRPLRAPAPLCPGWRRRPDACAGVASM